MKGVIRTFAAEKKYGFIEGDDGKHYLFHEDAFRKSGQVEKICDEAIVEFEQRATPTGYKAENCSLLDAPNAATYVEPDEFISSKSDQIRGWEIIEKGHWVVHGSSRDSSDAAKADMISGAAAVRANALIEVNYYKTTGSEMGTGSGTHYYTIHNFRGRVVKVAKKSRKGTLLVDDLHGLNELAEQKKRQLTLMNQRGREKEMKRKLLITAVGVILAVVFSQVNGGIVVALIIGIVFYLSQTRPAVDDSWLQKSSCE